MKVGLEISFRNISTIGSYHHHHWGIPHPQLSSKVGDRSPISKRREAELRSGIFSEVRQLETCASEISTQICWPDSGHLLPILSLGLDATLCTSVYLDVLTSSYFCLEAQERKSGACWDGGRSWKVEIKGRLSHR